MLSAPDEARLIQAMQQLASARPNYHGVTIFGPSMAPLGFLRGRYRGRALIQAEKTVDLQAVIASWLEGASLASGVRLQVDIDPYNFL